MIEIKGEVLADAIKAVKERHGDIAYAMIVGLLDGEARRIFEQPSIVPTAWYPLDAFVEFLGKDLEITAQGREEELIKWSEAVVEKELRGIYKVFVKFGSPEFLLKRISVVHQTYFRGVAVEVFLPSAGKATIKYTGFQKQHRLIGFSIIGFYTKALEISGAKDIKAGYATSIEDEKGYCELVLAWHGKHTERQK